MSESFSYGFEEQRLSLDVSKNLFEDIIDRDDKFAGIVGESARTSVIDLRTTSDGYRLLLDAEKAGRVRNDNEKRKKLHKFVYSLAVIDALSGNSLRDPDLDLIIQSERQNGSDRYGMQATIAWPEADPRYVQGLAILYMQKTAGDFNYVPKKIMHDFVYASVSREHGITLETNPAGSSDMGTDGMFYEPEERTFELYSHNLFNHELQLICVAGLIAIAKADKYLAS